MPALVPELVHAAMEPSTSPSDLLRRALVVARRLGVSELTDWISRELSCAGKCSGRSAQRKSAAIFDGTVVIAG